LSRAIVRSVATIATRWINRRQLVEVDFGDGLQFFRGPGSFEAFRQPVEPSAVFFLQIEQGGDRCGPACWPRGGPGRRRRRRSGNLLAQPGRCRACRSAALIGAAPMRGLDMPDSYCQPRGQARGRQSRLRDDPRGTRHWAPDIAPTVLYSGVWRRPDHDAAMRIDGEVPGRRGPFSETA